MHSQRITRMVPNQMVTAMGHEIRADLALGFYWDEGSSTLTQPLYNPYISLYYPHGYIHMHSAYQCWLILLWGSIGFGV